MQPKQIMLVDDEPRLLAALRRRLSADFDIVTFERGQAALDYLCQPHNVAVIVADMQMPEMNGVELLKNVKDVAPEVRRLMLTGNSDQETAMAAINEGKVFRFIRKPCDATKLKTIIDEALEDYEFSQTDLSKIESNSRKTDRSEDTQNTFLSIMSDELRTPLAQVITISGILRHDHNETDEKTMTKFLEHINESSISALAHIDRILHYTKIKSTEAPVEDKEQVDIVGIFRKEIEVLAPKIRGKLLTISLESLRKTDNVVGIQGELARAAHEILGNAITFSEVGGHISVIFKYDKENVAVRVSNSGAAELSRDRYASPTTFKQPDEDMHLNSKGMGLGLSIIELVAARNDVIFNIKREDSGGVKATLVFKRAAYTAKDEDLKLAS